MQTIPQSRVQKVLWLTAEEYLHLLSMDCMLSRRTYAINLSGGLLRDGDLVSVREHPEGIFTSRVVVEAQT